ncbi:MAG: AI-2E family transporter [Candidatus Gracilibacteria bacterium]
MKNENKNHNYNHNEDIVLGIQKYFLLISVILLLFLTFQFLAPFLSTLFIAAVIVAAVYPLKKFLNKRIKLPPSLSALLATLLVIVLVVLPLTFFFISVVGQASDAYVSISVKINNYINEGHVLNDVFNNYPVIDKFIERVLKYNPISTKDIFSTAGDFVGIISSFLLQNTANLLKHLTVVIFHVLVFLIGLFYFIRDGEKLVKFAHGLLPLSEKYRKELMLKIYHLLHSIIFGIFGAALAQGLLLWVGLTIIGVDNSIFWAALGAVLSPIPYIGIGIIWVPFAVSLFFGSHLASGIFFTIWCITLVANIDNFVKPYVIGSTSALHPFAVLIVMLGGALAFGIKGLIFGPFVLTLTLAFLHIYKLEYKRVLENPLEIKQEEMKQPLFKFPFKND